MDFNVDGLVTFVGTYDDSHSYAQFFRDGGLEAVATTIADDSALYAIRVERHVLAAPRIYAPILVAGGADYPLVLTACIIAARGLGHPQSPDFRTLPFVSLKRDILFCPMCCSRIAKPTWTRRAGGASMRSRKLSGCLGARATEPTGSGTSWRETVTIAAHAAGRERARHM